MPGVLNGLSSVSSAQTLLSGPWIHLARRTMFWTSSFPFVPKAMSRKHPEKQGTSLLTFSFEACILVAGIFNVLLYDRAGSEREIK